jgi:hypothetical protein
MSSPLENCNPLIGNKRTKHQPGSELSQLAIAAFLLQIRAETARFIESHDLTINDRAFGNFGKGLDDKWVVVIEGFASARK